MPLYLLDVTPFSRARGARVTSAAAYRAGERIRDARMKEAYNWLDRDDVVYKDIILPSKFARDATVNWARDRSTLWNAVESTNRRNARLGREVLVILPPELTPTQRAQLVRRFSQELSDRYQNAVDTTIHLPRPSADERHHHAHLLMTPREITPQGLGRRITCELSGVERQSISRRPGEWRRSTTLSEQVNIEPAVMASEIERLPDLEGFLKFASIPDWHRVALTPVNAPSRARTRPSPTPSHVVPPQAPPILATPSADLFSSAEPTPSKTAKPAKSTRKRASVRKPRPRPPAIDSAPTSP